MPLDPLTAVTAVDPYPYYADLVATAPLHRDPAGRFWVAASAAAAGAVLASERCAVRPAGEPVPAALVATRAGAIFAGLARMQDGDRHRRLRDRVVATIDAFDSARVAAVASEEAERLVEGAGGSAGIDPAQVTAVVLGLAVHVVGRLLAVPRLALPDLVALVDAFTGCLAPGSSPARIAAGVAAAGPLSSLLASAGCTEDVLPAAIGLLCQSYEATAGLLGNSLVALGRTPAIGGDVAGVVDATLRRDPPVQNTRRHVIVDGPIAGAPMRAGDTILVVLAAASRDPDSDHRWPFGAGRHACPGAAIATTIATAGLQALLVAGVDPRRLGTDLRYRPSLNTRVPLFGGAA